MTMEIKDGLTMIKQEKNYRILGAYAIFLSMISCSHNAHTGQYGQQVYDTISILEDRFFQKGIALVGSNTGQLVEDKFIYPFGKLQNDTMAAWRLAEWGSKKLLKETPKLTNGEVIYENELKKIAFSEDTRTMAVKMFLNAGNEYSKIRADGEYWPHLLLEQRFQSPRPLTNARHLFVKMDVDLIAVELKTAKEDLNPQLHTAQFQLFLTLQNNNPDAEGYKDFLWFGLPFYDYRYKDVEIYQAADVGKDDASQKFIYMAGSKDVMGGSLHDGKLLSIHKDILPYLLTAFEQAKNKGYLKDSQWEDMELTSMNIGWENPGPIDAGVEFKNFDIYMLVEKLPTK